MGVLVMLVNFVPVHVVVQVSEFPGSQPSATEPIPPLGNWVHTTAPLDDA
jgi:hypothetical protein